MTRKLATPERGYALLTVMFLAAAMVLLTMMAALNVATQSRRAQEDELAWRGNQYVRAIRLYYRKNGRFPQTIEDLTKHDVGTVRFIRKAYKDPMNKVDGSWRLIYVTPSGQLIGSVMHQALGQGGAAGALSSLFGGQPAGTAPGVAGASPQGQSAPAGTPGMGVASSTPGATPAAAGSPASPGSTDATTGEQNGVTGPVFGGNLIGVASKIKKPSLRVYQQGVTYFQWEFIWDPTKTAAPGTTPVGLQVPGTPGQQTPNGQVPPNGTAPPNPNGQQSQQSQIQQ